MPRRDLLTEKAPLLLPFRPQRLYLLAGRPFCPDALVFPLWRPCLPSRASCPSIPGSISFRLVMLLFPTSGTKASGCCDLRSPDAAEFSGTGGTLKLSNIRICEGRASRAFLDKINIVLDKIEGYLSGFENQFFNSRGLSGSLSVLLVYRKYPEHKNLNHS